MCCFCEKKKEEEQQQQLRIKVSEVEDNNSLGTPRIEERSRIKVAKQKATTAIENKGGLFLSLL